jgi:DNA polymerase III delta prime subunit
MSQNLLNHVFSAVLHLERSLSEIDPLLSQAPDANERKVIFAQHKKAVRQMRAAANRLQLANAADDVLESHRQITIFYGIQQMVRPEIMKMLASLLNPNVQVTSKLEMQSAH